MTDMKTVEKDLEKLLKEATKAKTKRYELLRENNTKLHIDNSSVRSFDTAMKILSKFTKQANPAS